MPSKCVPAAAPPSHHKRLAKELKRAEEAEDRVRKLNSKTLKVRLNLSAEELKERKRRERQRYYAAHPEKLREAKRKSRDTHPEKQREAVRKWRESNPEKRREQKMRYRRRRAEAKKGVSDLTADHSVVHNKYLIPRYRFFSRDAPWV